MQLLTDIKKECWIGIQRTFSFCHVTSERILENRLCVLEDFY